MSKFCHINKNLFSEFLNKIKNIKISHIWYGYANVLFLECGKLDKKSNKSNPSGEITFMLA